MIPEEAAKDVLAVQRSDEFQGSWRESELTGSNRIASAYIAAQCHGACVETHDQAVLRLLWTSETARFWHITLLVNDPQCP